MLNQLSNSIYYMSNDNDRERPVLGLVCGEKYSLVILFFSEIVHMEQQRIKCFILSNPC